MLTADLRKREKASGHGATSVTFTGHSESPYPNAPKRRPLKDIFEKIANFTGRSFAMFSDA